MAIKNVGGSAEPDMIVAWPDGQRIKWRLGWNLDSTGVPTSWSTIQSISDDVATDFQGVGACLAQLPDGGNDLDLIVGWVDNSAQTNYIEYRIGHNITPTGTPSWGNVKTVGGSGIGQETQGLGLTCTNLNEAGGPDLIFSWIDNPTDGNQIYYRIGFDPDHLGEVDAADWEQNLGIGSDRKIEYDTPGLGLADGAIDNSVGVKELITSYVDNIAGNDEVYYWMERQGRWKAHD